MCAAAHGWRAARRAARATRRWERRHSRNDSREVSRTPLSTEVAKRLLKPSASRVTRYGTGTVRFLGADTHKRGARHQTLHPFSQSHDHSPTRQNPRTRVESHR